jgi:AAA+ superfamily predicted ATPase
VISATNHVAILDKALFRRFDDVIDYDLPDKTRIIQALRAKLSNFTTEKIQWAEAATAARGLSFADIARACEDAIKDAIVHDRHQVTHEELMSAIRDRKSAVAHKEHTA